MGIHDKVVPGILIGWISYLVCIFKGEIVWMAALVLHIMLVIRFNDVEKKSRRVKYRAYATSYVIDTLVGLWIRVEMI